eukprot:823601_1
MGYNTDVVHYINLSIIFVIGLPIVIYSIWLLHLNWNEQFLLQRYRCISVLILILIATLLLFFASSFIFISLCYGLLEEEWPSSFYPSFIIAYAFTSQILFILYGIKVFILYFDCGYAQALSSKKWKILLNAKLFEDNWFVRNKHKYRSSLLKVTSA